MKKRVFINNDVHFVVQQFTVCSCTLSAMGLEKNGPSFFSCFDFFNTAVSIQDTCIINTYHRQDIIRAAKKKSFQDVVDYAAPLR